MLAPEILRGFHLLEADAGTGKTWTISGLVVRALIEREPAIDRILVVTFTRAATAELSRRIRERMRLLVGVQKRFRDGKVGNLAKRDFFADAAMLHGFDCAARGESVPIWAYDAALFTRAETGRAKKRREG